MIKLAIVNQKGGVGKTTIAFNLAQILADQRGTKVLVIDNDPQGNLTSSFLEHPADLKDSILNAYEQKALEPEKISESLDLLGSNIALAPVAERDFQIIFRLKESIEKLCQNSTLAAYDFVIIDCLPSFGHLHLAALNAADYVLVPVKLSPYALAGMRDLFDTIERVKKYFNPNIKVLGIIINQIDGRKLVMEREMEEALRERYKDLVFMSKISKRVKIEESPAFQKPITQYNAKGPAAKEFEALVKEVQKRIRLSECKLPIFKKGGF